jgi:sugar-specific transcriptional regulator TrmB
MRDVWVAVAGLQTAFATSLPPEGPTHPVEVITGREAVVQHVMQLQRAAQDEILVVDTPPYAAAQRQVTAAEVEHFRRGVRARVIYARSALGGARPAVALQELSERQVRLQARCRRSSRGDE